MGRAPTLWYVHKDGCSSSSISMRCSLSLEQRKLTQQFDDVFLIIVSKSVSLSQSVKSLERMMKSPFGQSGV